MIASFYNFLINLNFLNLLFCKNILFKFTEIILSKVKFINI